MTFSGARISQFQSALAGAIPADTATAPNTSDPSVAVVVNRSHFCGGGAAAARLAHNQEVTGASPVPATSSGDGLGNHQPGSITSGGSLYATARSGRALESARCPAVARFNDRRPA